jgi:hypothetical protein
MVTVYMEQIHLLAENMSAKSSSENILNLYQYIRDMVIMNTIMSAVTENVLEQYKEHLKDMIYFQAHGYP